MLCGLKEDGDLSIWNHINVELISVCGYDVNVGMVILGFLFLSLVVGVLFSNFGEREREKVLKRVNYSRVLGVGVAVWVWPGHMGSCGTTR